MGITAATFLPDIARKHIAKQQSIRREEHTRRLLKESSSAHFRQTQNTEFTQHPQLNSLGTSYYGGRFALGATTFGPNSDRSSNSPCKSYLNEWYSTNEGEKQ